MKIWILYICTGKYASFFHDFFRTSENYFLKNSQKQYYVFTDSEELKNQYSQHSNIHFFHQKKLWWPLDTLMRFWMFYGIRDFLKNEDFLVFFNANFIFKEDISEEEFLPNGKNEKLLAAIHAWFYNKPYILYPYERKKKSQAYIPYFQKWNYYQWSLNGGFTQDYLNLIEGCMKNIEKDFGKNYIARWHDESHLNKYLIGRDDVKALNPSYNFPEGANLPFVAKIILKDKSAWKSHSEIRAL